MDSQSDRLQKLKQGPFDLLIIGGGATGCGIALDAASRGLKAALIEAGDFSSGTSGKSTKLIHGGLRYLKSAMTHLDQSQFALVQESLTERKTLLEMAPHLTETVKLMIPCYSWLGAAYYRTGLKIYDWLAGKQSLGPSRWLSAEEVVHRFPVIKKKGLRGAVEFCDGQFDDARLNVALALTAEKRGAVVCNYTALRSFEKKEGLIVSANVEDKLTGMPFNLSARIFINATGFQADVIRRLDDSESLPLLQPSVGSHIVLSGKFGLKEAGLLIPKTSDGRLLFVLPWERGTLVGTTDIPGEGGTPCQATPEEIRFLLNNLNQELEIQATVEDIAATWAGVRPLVRDPSVHNTSKLSREHLIEKSSSGLYTIVGGKWTTFRKMAQNLLDRIAKDTGMAMETCKTGTVKVEGAVNLCEWSVPILQEYFSLDIDILEHLLKTYGDKAVEVAQLGVSEGLSERLAAGYPYILGEAAYAVRNEKALAAMDFLGRRIRLAFLDPKAALEALPKVIALMAKELEWDSDQTKRESQKAREELEREFFPVKL